VKHVASVRLMVLGGDLMIVRGAEREHLSENCANYETTVKGRGAGREGGENNKPYRM